VALCPFATHRLIPPGSNDPAIAPRIAILHVDAGNADSLYDYFNGPSGGIESHFFVKRDGEIEQYRDTGLQADANLDANDFAVSIETQGFAVGEWTPEQLDSIQRLLLWLHQEHPAIRLAPCDAWDGSGIGYHVMFGAPGHWTPVSKSCPGPDRVRQFHNVIVPWLRAGADQEDPMAEYADQLDAIQAKLNDNTEALARLEAQTDGMVKKDRQRMERVMARLSRILAESKDDATKRDLQAAVDELTADD
jgi:hypothetical protein